MKLAEQLKKAVLQAAIQGKLTEQLPEDGNASELIEESLKCKNNLIKNKIINKSHFTGITDILSFPYEVPNNWRLTKLDNLAYVTKLAGFEYTKYISPNKAKTGIPLFKGKNVQDMKLVFEFEDYISEDLSNKLSRSQLNRKCLLTPYVGSIGNIAIFNGAFKAHLGSNVGKIEFFNHNKQLMLEEYFLLYLKSPLGISELKKHKKATAQESISIEAIRDVDVLLPPLEEQKRIVEKLEQILPMIDTLEKDENQLEEILNKFPENMKASILQAAIQGKLTEQLPEDGNAEDELNKFFGKNYKNVNIEDYSFEIPDNWSVVKFSNIFSTISAKGHQVKITEVEKSGKFPVVSQSKNVIDGYNNDENKLIKITEPIIIFGDHTKVLKYIDFSFVIGADGTKLLDIKYANRKFMYYQLSYIISKLATRNYGRHFKLLKENVILIPPLYEQERIVEKLDQILPMIDSLKLK